MVGSRFYLRKMSREDVKKISAMVNLDSLGTSVTRVELDRADRKLVEAIAAVASNFKFDTYLLMRAYLAYLDQVLDVPGAKTE